MASHNIPTAVAFSTDGIDTHNAYSGVRFAHTRLFDLLGKLKITKSLTSGKGVYTVPITGIYRVDWTANIKGVLTHQSYMHKYTAGDVLPIDPKGQTLLQRIAP